MHVKECRQKNDCERSHIANDFTVESSDDACGAGRGDMGEMERYLIFTCNRKSALWLSLPGRAGSTVTVRIWFPGRWNHHQCLHCYVKGCVVGFPEILVKLPGSS